jgi:hypothetical protein
MTDDTDADPAPPAEPSSSYAPSFVTTEHFVLPGARATISESTGRATMFLGTVSGGLVRSA